MKKPLIATLISATVALSSPFVSAATPEFPHLETVGVGEVVATPDTANIQVAVTITRTSAKAAKKASDDAITALLKRLEKMGIDKKDIESANLSLQPQYSYPKNGEPKLTGYRASRNLAVTISDLKKLNSILDGALSDGVNRVNGISFSSSKEAELREKARMAAINDAKAKAESLASGFGETLNGVWEIRYMDQNPIRPVAMRMAQAENANASYMDAEITIRDRVEVVFALAE